jgi:hypothetical protein
MFGVNIDLVGFNDFVANKKTKCFFSFGFYIEYTGDYYMAYFE